MEHGSENSDSIMDERQILQMISYELSNSTGGGENDSIGMNRQNAYDYYLGNPDGNETPGRSKVVSTDVADAIEWILPEIVKAFTQNNDVVKFDPIGPDDEQQADLESQYVYDILTKKNNGFLNIYEFVKDALMQKNGFFKCFYEKESKVVNERYTGLSDIELQMLVSNPSIEIVERTDYMSDMAFLHDVKISRSFEKGHIRVVSVPPEEIRVSKYHNSICLKNCPFLAHVYLKTASDLVSDGHDKEFVDSLPSYSLYESDKSYRFSQAGESVLNNSDLSPEGANRLIEIAECYTSIDLDGDGISESVKVEVAGGEAANNLLSIEEIDEQVFVSGSAIIMPHKTFGLSIYDRLRQIQDQKTTLWRNILDNVYLQNNQRTIVAKGQVNLDDLMINRPGSIIRANRIDSLAPYSTPALSSDAYKMMDYLDKVRSERSGITPDGPITDNMIGDRVGSEGVADLITQREELVGLMVRAIAEVAIKPLCNIIRRLVIKHQDVAIPYKFKGNWIEVNPSTWPEREENTTIRVGTGSGNRKQEANVIAHIQGIQERLMAMPGQTLVRPQEFFNSVDDFAKTNGLTGASKYMLDPLSEEGVQYRQQSDQSAMKEKQMQDEIDVAQIEMAKAVAQGELIKAQSQADLVRLKSEADFAKNQLEQYKASTQNEISYLKQQLDEAKALMDKGSKGDDLEFKYWDAGERHSIERERMDVQREAAKRGD